MADPVRSTYRPNLGRNPTKKWAEARPVDYDADDWGDEYDEYPPQPPPPVPEPVSAGPQRQPGWGQKVEQRSQRNFTSPSTGTNLGRASYDAEDDRRYFSTGGPEQRHREYATTSSSLQHENDGNTTTDIQGPPALQVKTQFPGPNVGAQASSQVGTKSETRNTPFSAPVGRQPQPLHSDDQAESQPGHYPDFARVQAAGGANVTSAGHAPRQAGLSQQQISPRGLDLSQQAATLPSTAQVEAAGTKPLPFIRPADIYKRIEEEREKERRSQDSSRLSIDSISGRPVKLPTHTGESAAVQLDRHATENTDTSTKLMSNLDTAMERKSENALGYTSAGTTYPPDTPSNSKPMSPLSTTAVSAASRPQISRAASSVYTDRPDPTSASSSNSHPIPTAFGSAKSPSAESYLQNVFQYSPSKHRLSGLHSDSPAEETTEDFPNYNHGFSPKPTTALSSPKATNANSPLTKTDHVSRSLPTRSDKLQHQPSLGYKSAVDQAFDADQSSILSPTGTSDTFARTNSTSEISPIIQRAPDIRHAESSKYANPLKSLTGGHTSTYSHDRSESIATVKAPEQPQDNTILPATTFVPGYRRDSTPPVTETTRARRPLSVEVPAVQEPQHGVLSTVTTSTTSGKSPAPEMLPATQYTPVAGRQSPQRQFKSQSELSLAQMSRTESEAYEEWQAERRTFNAKHGIQDSDTASATMSSPVSRSESPAKGMVRDIAGKLDTSSGRSSPAMTHGSESRSTNTMKPPKIAAPASDTRLNVKPNKPPQVRSDSFRPPLPGAWQSYTTNESGRETPESSVPTTQPTNILEHGRTESSDSIPTATAPRQWQSSHSGPVDAAFAAAAAAGNAMAGAFSGSALTRDTSPDSDMESDDEETPSASQPHIAQVSETRDFALKSPQTQSLNSTPRPSVPESSEPRDVVSGTDTRPESSQQVDYPAPLRMSKLFENKQPSPRLSMPSGTQSDTDEGLEQLQYDIVQSLTPKPTNVPDTPVQPREVPLRRHETTRQFSIISDDGDTLPREYRSYFNDQQTSAAHDDLSEATPERKDKIRTESSTQSVPVPASVPDSTGPTSETQSFLGKRYSWEAPKAQHVTATDPSNIEFAKSITHDEPSTPTDLPVQPPSTLSPPTPTVHRAEDISQDTPRSSTQTALLPNKPSAALTFPKEKTDFRNILAFKEPSQRIRAFDENRQLYAEPSGLLDRWISSLNTPEHSDVFRSGHLPRAQTNIGPTENRPSPRRETTATSGTKQMQEDGKRLLVAAGKYGGKAGTVAKGLFARGKDKLRTVSSGATSSGDKVPSIGRRRSSNVDTDTSFIPRPVEPPVLPDQAPQIPTPSLETPTGETSWSTAFTQMFQSSNSTSPTSHAKQSPTVTRSTDWNRDLGGRSQDPSANKHKPWSEPTNTERPPGAVIASLPGRDNIPAKPQAFPEYSKGTRLDKNNAIQRTPGKPEQNAPRDSTAVSQPSTEADRPRRLQREDSLPLSRPRRPSSFSDVSDISAAQDEAADVLPRNVSPSLENSSRVPKIPLIVTPQPVKGEATQKGNRIGHSESTLPLHNSIETGNNNSKRLSQMQSGTQTLPGADLNPRNAEGDRQPDTRPFSFAGPETLNHTSSQHDSVKPIPPPLAPVAQQSPVKQNLPVDIEKSPQLNITEQHPAYRNSGHSSSDAEQMNPLPSSRRSPQDLEQVRKQQHIVVPERVQGEETYRIPGPYVQEYRSPRQAKPMTSQDTAQNFRDTPEQSPNVLSPMQNRFSTDVGRGQPSETISQSEWQPESERGKGRGFTSMLRNRSRSPSKQPDRQGAFNSTPQLDNVADEGKKRRPFFSLNKDSSLQKNDNRSVPVQDTGRDRKMSIDMFRPPMFTSKGQPDGKKKRTSGFGALFGKSGGKDRDNFKHERTASQPSAAQPPAPQLTPQSYQRSSMGNHIATQLQYPGLASESHHNSRQAVPEPYSQHARPSDNVESTEIKHGPSESDPYTQYDPTPSKVESKHGIPGSAYQETQAYHDHDEFRSDQGKSGMTDWQQPVDRSQMFPQPPSNPVSAMPWASNTRQTPSESLPPPVSASPIPSTRAIRDISYGQDRPYIPPVSPRPAHGGRQAGMADHVKNLHKRSRSPRLGRPPSDEHLQVDQIDSDRPGRRYSHDPASQLGTFVSKSMSPGGGVPRSAEDQEKPWTIGLPEGGDEDDSDNDALLGGQTSKSAALGTYHTVPDPAVMPPTSQYQRSPHDNVGNIVSPMTAIEPRVHSQNALPSPQRTGVPKEAGVYNSTNLESRHTNHQHQGQDDTTVETVNVPPTVSSAGQIPHPNPQPRDDPLDESMQPANVSNPPPVQPSSRPPRGVKQALIERAPNNSQVENTAESRPLTVAEKVIGIQLAGRGSVPEHRSTTPTPHSPALSVGTQPKSTTWPDARPSTTEVTTNTGTTVTTTTMRTGSKLGKGSVKTNTYIVDSNAPSRTNASAILSGDKSTNNTATSMPIGGTALTPISTNTNGNAKSQLPINPKDFANGVKPAPHGKSFDAVELPGSRPDGYESEEDIIMSATTYPGQEWMPEFAGAADWD